MESKSFLKLMKQKEIKTEIWNLRLRKQGFSFVNFNKKYV